MSLKKLFNEFHKNNRWNSKESISGTGSELRHTTLLRKNLKSILDKYQFKSMLDLPCGDYNWIKEMDLSNINYIGADIVPDLISNNKIKYPNTDFRIINLVTDKLPSVDVILVRDCLVHLSYDNIYKALENIKKHDIKYLLTTSHIKNKNHDIKNGDWRALNLLEPPFNIGGVIEIMNEGDVDGYPPKYKDKSLLLIDLSKMTYEK